MPPERPADAMHDPVPDFDGLSVAGEEDPGAALDDLPLEARRRFVADAQAHVYVAAAVPRDDAERGPAVARAARPRRAGGWRGFAWRVAATGALAGLLSGCVLVRLHRRGLDYAGLNAPSHWLWGRRALQYDDGSAKYTLAGAGVHLASSWFWALAYEALRSRRRAPDAVNAVVDAAAVTATAACVDLRLVPQRLTPGFERRLPPARVAGVYVAFGIGLALAGALAARRR